MTIEGDGDKELPDEDEETGNRLVHEVKNVVKDREFEVETVNVDVQGGGVGTLQAKVLQLQHQEQTREVVNGWERFLHVTSIKVLLVENDDSTRHIVTALLRNCKYEGLFLLHFSFVCMCFSFSLRVLFIVLNMLS